MILALYHITLILILTASEAPDSFLGFTPPASQAHKTAAKMHLGKVESALASGNVQALSPYLSSKVHLNLITGESGYFSSEQTFFILKKFFSNYSPASFSFSSENLSSRSPYGIGTLHYLKQGRQGSAQCYLAFSLDDTGLKITQITIAFR